MTPADTSTNTEAQRLAVEKALEQLRDIHLPTTEPASWIAMIDATLIGTALAAIAIGALTGWWLWRKRTTRRIALKQLQKIAARQSASGRTDAFPSELAQLLRQYAISKHGQSAAGLTDEAWLRWLDTHSGRTGSADFAQGIGRVLLSGPYCRPEAPITVDAPQLITLVRRWLITNT